MTKLKRNIIITLVAVLLLLLSVLWLLWYFYPVDKEEMTRTDATLITETRYILSVDGVDVFAFDNMSGDTLMTGIVDSKAKVNATGKSRVSAQWVRRYGLLPYCGGTLAVMAYDTADVCRYSDAKVASLLRNEAEHITKVQGVIADQQHDIAYFLKTHVVTDNGFDIVARYGNQLCHVADSFDMVASKVKKALEGNKMNVRLERRYYINSYAGMIECEPLSANDSVQTLRIKPRSAQKDVQLESGWTSIVEHSRLTPATAFARLKMRMPKTKPLLSKIDSLGTYSGRRDSLGRPDGYGRFYSKTGQFYEGEWNHGERDGVGFSISPGKRLRLGEWEKDRFLGERITYTPERIYGIDLSRFQHECGRKRYKIEWDKLRIVSLGKISKKKVDGEVDYPITFIYIKATEGRTLKNKYFASDYVASRKHGYKTGAYHFFSLTSTGKEQAAFFLKHSRYQQDDIPPVLDLEPSDAQITKAGGIEKVLKQTRIWLETVERQRGVRPILYVSQSFVNKHLKNAPDIKKKYDVWIARYGEYKPDVNLVYWQLSPDGRVRGIHGDVDINVYNGFDFSVANGTVVQ